MNLLMFDELLPGCAKYFFFQYFFFLLVKLNFFHYCFSMLPSHGVQRRMILVNNFFVFSRLLFFAVLLLYET